MTLFSATRPASLVALIAAQTLCAVFFLLDVVSDGRSLGLRGAFDSHFFVEASAALALIAAVAFELRYLLQLLRRKAHLERQLSEAARAFHEVVAARFRDWALTPAEEDVALFTLKGLSIPEIAGLRGTAEGTVKSHLNAIYRKAGATGRGAFLSLFIEDLMESRPVPVLPQPGAEAAERG